MDFVARARARETHRGRREDATTSTGRDALLRDARDARDARRTARERASAAVRCQRARRRNVARREATRREIEALDAAMGRLAREDFEANAEANAEANTEANVEAKELAAQLEAAQVGMCTRAKGHLGAGIRSPRMQALQLAVQPLGGRERWVVYASPPSPGMSVTCVTPP